MAETDDRLPDGTALAALIGRLIDALEIAGVPYALGDALALGYHAPPRGTRDVSINVFVGADAVRPILETLRNAGLVLDIEASVRRAELRGDIVAHGGDIRVDLFVNSIPLHDEASRRRIAVRFGNRPTWVLSAEDLVVLKLLYDRPKDRLDVEQMIAAQGERLDAGYARAQLVAHVGEDDGRVRFYDQCLGRFVTSHR